MKIVIIGGSGLIGTRLTPHLVAAGHDIVVASPSRGIDALTGAGVADALAGADILVDVSNAHSFESQAVLDFFETSTRNLTTAARTAGVGHYVALSVVGTDRLPYSGYFRAKLAQERLIAASGLPHTILRATQFFEFMASIAWSPEPGDTIALSSRPMQPIAADDVAEALTRVALAPPVDGIVDLAGPEAAPLADFVGRWLAAQGDRRRVIAGADTPYFGAVLGPRSLVPLGEAIIMPTRFDAWLDAKAMAQ